MKLEDRIKEILLNYEVWVNLGWKDRKLVKDLLTLFAEEKARIQKELKHNEMRAFIAGTSAPKDVEGNLRAYEKYLASLKEDKDAI